MLRGRGIESGWRRLPPIAIARTNICVGRGSSWPRVKTAVRRRRCARPGWLGPTVALAASIHEAGIDGLLREETCRSGKASIPDPVVARLTRRDGRGLGERNHSLEQSSNGQPDGFRPHRSAEDPASLRPGALPFEGIQAQPWRT